MNGLEALIAATLIAGNVTPTSGLSEEVVSNRSNECLAMNMYHEARNQGTAGVLAVSAVVLNRVNDSRFPNTVCGVVEQGPTRASWQDPKVRFPIKHKCQFSWYCDGKSDWPTDINAWVEAQQIAYNILVFGDIRGITEGATHYHANYVEPAWAKDFALVGRIGVHIFYRWEN
jgi:spore germination cell wall hydrolase CwlJ-like protein